jgi:hypothetical protein
LAGNERPPDKRDFPSLTTTQPDAPTTSISVLPFRYSLAVPAGLPHKAQRHGRSVDSVCLVAQKVRARGFQCLIGEYILIPKNNMVLDLHTQMGFAARNGKWELDLQSFKELKTFIKVK